MVVELEVAQRPADHAIKGVHRRDLATRSTSRGSRTSVTRLGETFVWVLVLAVTLLIQRHAMVLHNDIRFTFGSVRMTSDSDFSSLGVFVHRPMANRVLMDGFGSATFDGVASFERSVASAAIILTGLVCAAFAAALSQWVSRLCGLATGLALFCALAWASGLAFLQPEWTAVLLSVAGLSLAIGPRTRLTRLGSPYLACAGALFAAGALQKYATITTVALALGIVLVLDRRRPDPAMIPQQSEQRYASP